MESYLKQKRKKSPNFAISKQDDIILNEKNSNENDVYECTICYSSLICNYFFTCNGGCNYSVCNFCFANLAKNKYFDNEQIRFCKCIATLSTIPNFSKNTLHARLAYNSKSKQDKEKANQFFDCVNLLFDFWGVMLEFFTFSNTPFKLPFNFDLDLPDLVEAGIDKISFEIISINETENFKNIQYNVSIEFATMIISSKKELRYFNEGSIERLKDVRERVKKSMIGGLSWFTMHFSRYLIGLEELVGIHCFDLLSLKTVSDCFLSSFLNLTKTNLIESNRYKVPFLYYSLPEFDERCTLEQVLKHIKNELDNEYHN